MFPRDPVPAEALAGAGVELVQRILRPTLAAAAASAVRLDSSQRLQTPAQAAAAAAAAAPQLLTGGMVQLVLGWLSRSSAAAGDWQRLEAFLRALVDAGLSLGARGALLRVLPLVETSVYAVQARSRMGGRGEGCASATPLPHPIV